MNIRVATISDLQEILKVYSFAREFMAKTGNPHQWADGHPKKELLLSDFPLKRLYVLEDSEGIAGVFMFDTNPDPTYSYIEDGEWPNNEPYGVIHRIASMGRAKGVLKAAVEFAKLQVSNIRIDTHEDNIVMQTALSKLGFKRCGIIYLENGDPRIAYQLVV